MNGIKEALVGLLGGSFKGKTEYLTIISISEGSTIIKAYISIPKGTDVVDAYNKFKYSLSKGDKISGIQVLAIKLDIVSPHPEQSRKAFYALMGVFLFLTLCLVLLYSILRWINYKGEILRLKEMYME